MSTLVIRADAAPDIGTGHVMRCLALAQAWQDKGGDVVFISHCESEALQNRIAAGGFGLVSLDKTHPHPLDIDFTQATLSKLKTQNKKLKTWIVIDGYHFDADYQKKIKDAGYKLLWIDDYGHAAHYHADLILNQNISANVSLYTNRESCTQLLMGTRYALLRREFKRWQGWQREHPPVARKVLVTLGGGDPDNITVKVIKALKQVNIPELEAQIVVGPANPHLEALEREIGTNSNLQLITNATNMPELMAWADLAVAAGGSTNWEFAFMGLPSLTMILAENQCAVVETLHDHGLSINIGWYKDVSLGDIAKFLSDLMKNNAKRKEMAKIGKQCVDERGSERITNIMHCADLLLREASIEDCEVFWKWVNDPDVRQSSFHSEYIPMNEHERWFREKLNDPNCIQFIAFDQDNRAIGQVRFDVKNDEADVSVIVNKDFRGSGYGTCLIRKGIVAITQLMKINTFNAYVKFYNQASIRSFERSGFTRQGAKIISDHQAVHMIFHGEQN